MKILFSSLPNCTILIILCTKPSFAIPWQLSRSLQVSLTQTHLIAAHKLEICFEIFVQFLPARYKYVMFHALSYPISHTYTHSGLQSLVICCSYVYTQCQLICMSIIADYSTFNKASTTLSLELCPPASPQLTGP